VKETYNTYWTTFSLYWGCCSISSQAQNIIIALWPASKYAHHLVHEQLAQSCYLAVDWPRVKPVNSQCKTDSHTDKLINLQVIKIVRWTHSKAKWNIQRQKLKDDTKGKI